MSGNDAPCYFGRTILIGKQLNDFLPGRSFLIKHLTVDDFAIRVQNEIRPPVVERRPRNAIWLLAAMDDLGNECRSTGGAFGL